MVFGYGPLSVILFKIDLIGSGTDWLISNLRGQSSILVLTYFSVIRAVQVKL